MKYYTCIKQFGDTNLGTIIKEEDIVFECPAINNNICKATKSKCLGKYKNMCIRVLIFYELISDELLRIEII